MAGYGNPRKKRKKPAYPKPGSGEDFPARRPGTRVGETKNGQKIMQATRATQTRRSKRKVGTKSYPYTASPIPTDSRGQVRTPNWPHVSYGGSKSQRA